MKFILFIILIICVYANKNNTSEKPNLAKIKELISTYNTLKHNGIITDEHFKKLKEEAIEHLKSIDSSDILDSYSEVINQKNHDNNYSNGLITILLLSFTFALGFLIYICSIFSNAVGRR